jgi:hypothetical protein
MLTEVAVERKLVTGTRAMAGGGVDDGLDDGGGGRDGESAIEGAEVAAADADGPWLALVRMLELGGVGPAERASGPTPTAPPSGSASETRTRTSVADRRSGVR